MAVAQTAYKYFKCFIIFIYIAMQCWLDCNVHQHNSSKYECRVFMEIFIYRNTASCMYEKTSPHALYSSSVIPQAL